MKDTIENTDSDESTRRGGPTRRRALKLLGASALGGPLVASQPATAVTYQQTETEDGVDDGSEPCGKYVKLSTGTQLGHVTTTDTGSEWRHQFHFVTCGGAVDGDGDALNAIYWHEFLVDGCDYTMETLIDDNDTGAYPADHNDEVLHDLGDLAETAAGLAFEPIGIGSAGIEAGTELVDLFSKSTSCSDYKKNWKFDRDSHTSSRRARATTQGDFFIEYPKDSYGKVTLDTQLQAIEGNWCNGSSSYAHASVTNTFVIWCYSDGSVSISA